MRGSLASNANYRMEVVDIHSVDRYIREVVDTVNQRRKLMNVITASSPSIAGEIARFGSALSIAFALNMRDKRHNRLNRVVESQSYIQKILEKEGCDLGIDDDMEAAFRLLRSDHEKALREIDGIFNEIFALGFVAGTEPATDSQFSGNGLQRPTKQFLDDFFSDADN